MEFGWSYVLGPGLGLQTGLGLASWTGMLVGRKLIQFIIESHWFVLSARSTPITGMGLGHLLLRKYFAVNDTRNVKRGAGGTQIRK